MELKHVTLHPGNFGLGINPKHDTSEVWKMSWQVRDKLPRMIFIEESLLNYAFLKDGLLRKKN